MKSYINAAALFAVTASAHSWLHCTDYDNSKILDWMKGNATENPQFPVDPIMLNIGEFCKGWPRAKANPGNWIDESSNYAWDIQGKVNGGDTNICHPSQRDGNYLDGAPMAKTKAGGKLKLMFGGNGHARGSSVEGQGKPGDVVVYWTGKPDSQLSDVKDLTKENELHRQGFSDEAFMYPEDPNIWKPEMGLMDKGNWQTFTVPEGTAPGKYSFAWVWRYNEKPQWSTCFDVQVS